MSEQQQNEVTILTDREWLARQMELKVVACRALAHTSRSQHLARYWDAQVEAFTVAAAFIRQCFPSTRNPMLPMIREEAKPP